MLAFKIFCLGLAILAGAIVLNAVSAQLGIKSWYEFLRNPSSTSLMSYFWLFLLYPALLGLIAYITSQLLHLK